MMGSGGGSSDDSFQAVASLLTVVTDPKAAQKRLFDLSQQTKVHEAALEALRKLHEEHEALKVNIEAMRDELTRRVMSHDENTQKVAAEFAARETALARHVEELNAREVHIESKQKNLDEREVVVVAAESSHQAKVANDHANFEEHVKVTLASHAEAHANKVSELTSKIESLDEKHKALDEKTEAAAKLKNFWEKKVEALKGAIG